MSAPEDPQTLRSASAGEGGARQPTPGVGAHALRVPTVVQRTFVVVQGPLDARIAAIAAVQEGRVARWQLLLAGVGEHPVRWRLRNGLLTPEHRGVYSYGHPGETAHSTEIAALLTRGPEALVCGHRAAGMYGFRPMPEGVDLLVPDTHGGGSRAGIRIHRSGDAARLTRAYLGGVPVVSAAWVLMEIAADLGMRAMEVALDEAFGTGAVNREDVRAVVDANPTRAGAGLLKELLSGKIVGNPSRSDGQERLLALVRQARLPDPQMDAQIGGGFSADLFWAKARVAAEYDSYVWHSSRRAWARDRRKDAHCREQGIVLVRATAEDVDAGRFALIARLAGLIASRS